jgi:hypothetical protein
MASNTNTPVVAIENAKTKAPKLSAKYEKFLVFGYWFTEQLKQKNIIVDENPLFQQLTMFSSVEEQTLYFAEFFEQLKTSTKSMKAVVKQNNKPPAKAKKTKDPAEKPAKKTNGRKKKDNAVVNDKQEELVAELVAAAQSELPAVEKPKRKYSRKTKASTPVVEEPVVEEPPVFNTPEAKRQSELDEALETIQKPLTKKKATKKNQSTPVPAAPPAEPPAAPKKSKQSKKKQTVVESTPEPIKPELEEEEEINVYKFSYKGITYLRDDNNNIYDLESSELIGVFADDVVVLN